MPYERQTSAKATTFAPEFRQFWRRAENSQILTPGGKPAPTKLAAAATCVSNRVPVNTFSEFVLLPQFFSAANQRERAYVKTTLLAGIE